MSDTTIQDARNLIRSAKTAALATRDRNSLEPYVSLVAVATTAEGSPLFLISKLAEHTQNLLEHDGASALFQTTDPMPDPLAGGRITVIGRVKPLTCSSELALAKSRFLSWHPSAVTYADFADFGYFKLEPDRGHFIGGFGRIITVPGAALLEAAV